MIIKKIISTIMCSFIFAASATLPAYAAKPASCHNKQIVSEVKKFNDFKLQTLQSYIMRTDIESKILSNLIDLYDTLDSLVVSDINVARDLNAPDNIYDNYSIGSQLEHLFSCLFIIDYNSYHNNTYENVNSIFNEAGSAFFDSSSTIPEIRAQLSETRAKLIIDSINGKLDQMELCKNKKNKNNK